MSIPGCTILHISSGVTTLGGTASAPPFLGETMLVGSQMFIIQTMVDGTNIIQPTDNNPDGRGSLSGSYEILDTLHLSGSLDTVRIWMRSTVMGHAGATRFFSGSNMVGWVGISVYRIDESTAFPPVPTKKTGRELVRQIVLANNHPADTDPAVVFPKMPKPLSGVLTGYFARWPNPVPIPTVDKPVNSQYAVAISAYPTLAGGEGLDTAQATIRGGQGFITSPRIAWLGPSPAFGVFAMEFDVDPKENFRNDSCCKPPKKKKCCDPIKTPGRSGGSRSSVQPDLAIVQPDWVRECDGDGDYLDGADPVSDESWGV